MYSSIVSIAIPCLNQIDSQMTKCMPTIIFFPQSVIPFIQKNLTHSTRIFNLNCFNTIQNYANRFCFMLTLRPTTIFLPQPLVSLLAKPWLITQIYMSYIGIKHNHMISKCGVTVSTSAFIVYHQCYCAGLSLTWGFNLWALVCGIFWSWLPEVFSGYSGFLPSFVG